MNISEQSVCVFVCFCVGFFFFFFAGGGGGGGGALLVGLIIIGPDFNNLISITLSPGPKSAAADTLRHTPSIAFRHLPPKEGRRKPVLRV